MTARKYSPEFKDACVQKVIRNSRAVPQVARENGVVEQTLRNWVNAYKKDHPDAMADHMRTSLVPEALDMAARNGHIREEITVMHTDSGTQGSCP